MERYFEYLYYLIEKHDTRHIMYHIDSLIIDPNYGSSASPSASGRSTPKGSIIDKPLGTGKKRGRPSKAVMREREEAKRARGELPEEQPKEKVPKRRGRKPKIDWASMSEEVNIKQFLSNLQFLYIRIKN